MSLQDFINLTFSSDEKTPYISLLNITDNRYMNIFVINTIVNSQCKKANRKY